MKHTFTKFIAAALIAVTLITSGCATVFLPGKQKITIRTASKDAEVYVSKEKIGKGKIVTGKVEKGSVQQVVVKYGDGYLQTNDVLMPHDKRVPAYFFMQALNLPFLMVFYGIYAIVLDTRIPKAFAYDKVITIDTPRPLPKRAEDAKYVYLSNISLDIDDYEKEIVRHYGMFKQDLKYSMQKAEAETNMDRQKADAKAEKQKKKGKNKEYLDEEEGKDIKYEDVIFTDELMKNLYEGGFTDTVNNIFSDNNNTLVLSGKIDKIDQFVISPNKAWSTGSLYKTRTDMVWYIKNTYGEVMDSVSTVQMSESFTYERGDDMLKKTVGNCVKLSFFELLNNKAFTKYAKIETDFNPKNEATKINKPKYPVKQKQDAAEASVIVKTDKGHGSGFAISNDGYVVTNYHVICGDKSSDFPKITVINGDGEKMDAKVVKYNKYRDVALLKVEGNFKRAFNCSSTKEFSKMQDVYTIGAPKSIELGQSISTGVISNERNVNNNNLIQLNMSVNSGNSGGPIFDSEGKLHGVVVSKLVGKNTEGVSFAVPGYLLTDYLNLKY